MAKTTLENLRLGVFVIIGTTLIVLAAYLIGNRQNMFGNTFSISAVFNNVNGLQSGNNVRFSGINVGTVENIEMINDSTIRVNMIIEEKMLKHIRRDAIATIGSDGLVGSMLISITPGLGSESLVVPGDELKTQSRLVTQDMLSTLNITNENAALLTADLLKVTQSLAQGKGILGKLLNDTVMATSLEQTISNLEHASKRTNSMMTKLNKEMGRVNFEESAMGILLADTISGNNIKSILSNFETASKEIEEVTKDINSVMKEIKNGKGAVNYLTTDSTFVNNLDTTIRNIEQGAQSFNENMEALKHNFLTRGYFRKLERRQKKEAEKNQN
ncbi:phospholipid/cholesterol/gamma-HCH transport system substrate-binding protein [Saonia flava]|uniref:Phospholipid/cholesterol/gamma-HCH transport system substrate-binding protein n=1 Tax=Saonia flava TaxID=523696 RepID=A0A846QN07_9FLAO|nr:MlaD family protein [Saonia flava]NJB70406.1 phospholipid/cholesterol/gamma-HCH transport system substrate-binding protein [Saonia flava]